MKREKKILKFNKIKVANINFIKGGDETNGNSIVNACQNGNNFPSPDEASAINNPCSDGCNFFTLNGDILCRMQPKIETVNC